MVDGLALTIHARAVISADAARCRLSMLRVWRTPARRLRPSACRYDAAWVGPQFEATLGWRRGSAWAR